MVGHGSHGIFHYTSPASRAQHKEVNVGCCKILKFLEAMKIKFLKIKSGSFRREEHRYQFLKYEVIPSSPLPAQSETWSRHRRVMMYESKC